MEFMWIENYEDTHKFNCGVGKKKENYRFTGAASKGEWSTGRVHKVVSETSAASVCRTEGMELMGSIGSNMRRTAVRI